MLDQPGVGRAILAVLGVAEEGFPLATSLRCRQYAKHNLLDLPGVTRAVLVVLCVGEEECLMAADLRGVGEVS